MEDNIELKIKFTQTDLTDKGYIYKKMTQGGNIFNPSLIYENSDFLSKLDALNNYAGGVITKHKRSEPESDNANIPNIHGIAVSNADGDCRADVKEYKPDDYVLCYSEGADGGYDEYYGDVDFEIFDDFEDFGDFEDFDELEEDAEDADFDEADVNNEDENDNELNYNEVQVEFNTTGKMSVWENQITITYDEGDLLGFRNAMVNIMVDPKNPDIITIQKDNLVKSTLTLEKDKRSISDYDNSLSPVTVSVKTLKMMNNMTKKGGEIDLLYTVEANGSPTEMVSYSLSAQRKLK